MNLRRVTLILVVTVGALGFFPTERTYAQLRWFDEYSQVTWKEEQFHLDNFAHYLEKNPGVIGYMGYFSAPGSKEKTARQRAERARKYLMKEFALSKSRFVLIYGGNDSNVKSDRIVLHPAFPSDPPPKFRID